MALNIIYGLRTPIFISHEPQAHISNCLLTFSTLIPNRHLHLHMFSIQLWDFLQNPIPSAVFSIIINGNSLPPVVQAPNHRIIWSPYFPPHLHPIHMFKIHAESNHFSLPHSFPSGPSFLHILPVFSNSYFYPCLLLLHTTAKCSF